MDAPPVYRRRPAARSGEAPVAAGNPGSVPQDAALPPDVRFRAALLGIVLAVLATAIVLGIALLIVTGPFHTHQLSHHRTQLASSPR